VKHLSTLLHDNTVYLDIPCSDRTELLQWIANHFATRTGQSAEYVYQSLLEREQLGSTGLGKGVAIPHGRLRGLNTAYAVIVRTHTPLNFDAPDDEAVCVFFALLVPEKATDAHLEVLSEIVQVFSTESLRNHFMNASTTQDILNIIHTPSSHFISLH
jgi:nitrogen PTS system EIIA component